MTADLSALIARLEAAEVGSRELGRDVLLATNIVREVDPSLFYGVGNEDTWHFGDDAEQDGFWRILPDPSTSLDAALALAERLGLDAWHIMYAALMNWKAHDPRGPASKIMPLALCIAILRAKQGEA